MKLIEIGHQRQVFWDETLLDMTRTTAERRQHTPIMRDVVLTHDLPWEGDGCNAHAIFYDDGRFRMYYLAWQMISDDGSQHTLDACKLCYAESEDGIHWTKPELGICAYRGSTANNILIHPVEDMTFVFKDTNPDCPSSERYKAIVAHRLPELKPDGTPDRGLFCYVSADGLHFKPGWVMSRDGKFDTQNTVVWQPEQRRYLAYVRDFHPAAPSQAEAQAWGVRDIRVMESRDFRTWSVPRQLDFGGKEDYPLYCNAILSYERAPDMLVGMPSRYVERQTWTANFDQLPGRPKRWQRHLISPRYGLAVTDCVLMTSRDGQAWDRDDEAWLRPGIERGTNWVYGDCFPAPALLETASDLPGAPSELSLYVFENHWLGIPAVLRRYTLRLDGLRSYSAPYAERRIVTRPLVFAGSVLSLNFSTSARGRIDVLVHGADETLSSGELFGDTLDRRVDFAGALRRLAGQLVVLEFILRDADLFAMQFIQA